MKNWIHITGVCGKATSLVAYMFKDLGWFVTGSDIQYFPPASDFLVKNKIPHAEGYTFKHLTKNFWLKLGYIPPKDNPDICMVISTVSRNNPELKYAMARNIKVMPMSQILGEYLVKKESIVVVGSSGKTTTTAMCAFALSKLGYNPSFMIGADVLDFEYSISNTDSIWSVVEGDEYHNIDPIIEGKPKFMEYKPKYIILTNLNWEHQDVFKTFENYLDAFADLIRLLPEDGLLVYNQDDANISKLLTTISDEIRPRMISFGEGVKSNYFYKYSIDNSKTKFVLHKNKQEICRGETTLLGSYNIANITAVFALLDSLGLNLTNFSEIISKFRGVRKRLEILFQSENLVVIDDFGVAPSRAKRTLETIKKYYPDKKIVVVFDPNAGSRIKDKSVFKEVYENSFQHADFLYIPELSNFDENLLSRDKMIEYLKEMNFKVFETLEWLEEIKSIVKKEQCVVVFLSSYRLTKISHDFAKKFL
ncbi:MAG: UDP-N-acetylmuramate--L-alanyl-gamma-D-glutamyl-meso-2,6-diaminoheptandioate ligase [Candidatus Dojkabacteria bacterium]|nr:MAG: UDP-N-acetylmuramate--L-alanyl-gamma-D-glutamyl-meso-2,6-diaminoheptandioate ligase [Candidatus Dojkabacteria bacterium]